MILEERPLTECQDTISVHNIAFPSGRIAVRKGTTLTPRHLETLRELGLDRVLVAVLAADDVPEDEAAAMLAESLQTPQLDLSRAAGGRINLRATVTGLLVVAEERLLALNTIPGVTLATLPQYTVVGPESDHQEVATLKIIPYAIPRADLDRARQLIHGAAGGLLTIRPFPPAARAALLLTGEPVVHDKLQADFEPPIRTRLARLGVPLRTVEAVPADRAIIREAAARLAADHNLLVVAGQTSIMDPTDTTPQALQEAGAEVTVHGAPVEPGNLIALAYFPQTPVLCAPGCARSLDHNIVDLVLPRLLIGERLDRTAIAQLGLGGLLKHRQVHP